MKSTSLKLKYPREEKGGLAVLVAFMTFSLIAITSLAADIGVAKSKRVNIQAATDMGALAGVHKLMVGGAQISDVVNEARNIANANDGNATYATPEVGVWNWNNNTFTAGAAGTPNAVRVTSTGSVSTYFAKIFGAENLSAASESIAAYGTPTASSCLIPFGLEDTVLDGHEYGDIIDISRASAGNWGKIDIDGNMSSNPAFIAAMTSGFCSRSVKLGDTFTSATGFAGVSNGFEDRMEINPIISMPVVQGFSNGNSTVTVVGFVSVKLIMQQGHGNGWSGRIQFLQNAVGTSINGNVGEPWGNGLGLVR
jgi:hypothetical protein